jgi:hypothetical protein
MNGDESLSKKWSEPPSPSPPTPPTYLPCAREKWAQRGEMAISNKVVRGGGRNRGAVSAGGHKILPPPFLPACGSSRHLHGRSRSCGGWPLLAHRSQRRGWQTNISFHTTRLVLCFQQNQWDWQPYCKLGQSILVVLCAGSTLLTDAGSVPYQKSASSNLQKWFLSPTGQLKFGFILRENLLMCLSYLPLGVSQRVLWDIKQRYASGGDSTWEV